MYGDLRVLEGGTRDAIEALREENQNIKLDVQAMRKENRRILSLLEQVVNRDQDCKVVAVMGDMDFKREESHDVHY